MNKLLVFLIIIFFSFGSHVLAQNPILPANQQIDWSIAGIPGGIPDFPNSLDVTDFGAVGDGVTNDLPAFQAAINAAPDSTAVFVPAGNYRLNGTLVLNNDHTVLRGDCPVGSTKLLFHLSGSILAIQITHANAENLDQVLNNSLPKGTTSFILNDATGYTVGKYAEIRQDNDPALMYTDPAWDVPGAATSVGQLFKVVAVNGNTITVDRPLFINYNTSLNPVMRPLNNMRRNVGVENLYLEMITPGNYNVFMRDAVNCWIRNVESKKTNKGHFFLQRAIGCEIRDSYAHESHNYGSGGNGYGIVVGRHSTNHLFENNIFRRLRHAMIVSKGVTGCVFGYNYSTDQYWQNGFQGADLSLHGHYPNMNLFEGNVVEFAHNSDYWGPSGPGNTLFRNRIYVTSIRISDASHYQNVVGNEILQGSLIVDSGVYNTWKKANNVQGSIQNPVSGAISPSLYHSSKPDFLGGYPFPPIGPEYTINSHSIPSRDRFLSGNPMQVPTCPCYLNLTSANLNGIYEASGQIKSTGKIQPGATTIFDSGERIELNPGFKVETGGDFQGIIDGCDD